MVDYQDIRDLRRRGIHRGLTYWVKVRADDAGARYTLVEFSVGGMPAHKIGDTFDSLEEAFDFGVASAEAAIASLT